MKIDKIDRFEVIDKTGRAYVKGSIYGTPVKVKLSLQDDGRTFNLSRARTIILNPLML